MSDKENLTSDRIRQQAMVRNPFYTDRDFDICECGDYRHQHENGTGRCKMPDDLCHGFKPCLKFRLTEGAHSCARQ
jgi:hypothetical protein